MICVINKVLIQVQDSDRVEELNSQGYQAIKEGKVNNVSFDESVCFPANTSPEWLPGQEAERETYELFMANSRVIGAFAASKATNGVVLCPATRDPEARADATLFTHRGRLWTIERLEASQMSSPLVCVQTTTGALCSLTFLPVN